MASSVHRIRTDRGSFAWPFALILLAVLIPSVGILWMTRAVLENERLAIHQRLAETNYSQLNQIKTRYESEWSDRLDKLDSLIDPKQPLVSFRQCVESGVVDSVVVLGRDGSPIFPCEPTNASPNSQADNAQWNAAEALEFESKDLSQAMNAYRRIRDESTDESAIGRAEQAIARCLLKLDFRSEGINELERLLNRTDAIGTNGRSLALDAGILLLELYERNSMEAILVYRRLSELLADSRSDRFAASQRRFVIRRLIEQDTDEQVLPTWNAELLASETLSRLFRQDDKRISTVDWKDDVWSIPTHSNGCVAIIRRATLEAELERIVKELSLPENTEIRLHWTSEMVIETDSKASVSKSISLQSLIPGAHLSLVHKEIEPTQVASKRTAYYAGIATAMIGLSIVLTGFVYSMLRKQSHVARLKNDLVATVSHELKTPLASIRLLVDTLIEKRSVIPLDAMPKELAIETQTAEYLGLIASENERLTRLVDNFLTFSRLESGKQTLFREQIDLREAVETATNRMRESFMAKGIELTVATSESLMMVGDMDAVVMAIDNLLSNALKYSQSGTCVNVLAERQGEENVLKIRDQGIGLSPSEQRRVFDRFYQVDQRLSRTGAGCGLGLSIVKSIVEAHSGKVAVESQPNQGTVFLMSFKSCDQVDENKSVRATKGTTV